MPSEYISSMCSRKNFLALNLLSLKVGVTISFCTEKACGVTWTFFTLSIPESLYSLAFSSNWASIAFLRTGLSSSAFLSRLASSIFMIKIFNNIYQGVPRRTLVKLQDPGQQLRQGSPEENLHRRKFELQVKLKRRCSQASRGQHTHPRLA